MNKNEMIESKMSFLKDITLCFFLCALAVLVTGMGDAYAATSGIGNAICEVPKAVISTNLGRGIATIGILVVGIMATLGRVTWTQAVVVAVGIAVIFGAVAIAGTIASGGGANCSL